MHRFTLLPASQHLWLRLVELRLGELEGVLDGQCLVSDPIRSSPGTWWQALYCWTGLSVRVT